jgi:hypothetical protein
MGTNGSIVDSSGNTWAIDNSGVITENGQQYPGTANVIELAYEQGVVWQENNQDLWWSYDASNNSWTPQGSTSPVPTSSSGSGSTSSPPPTTSGSSSSHQIELDMGEDAWRGNAEFTFSIDGKQIGGTNTVTALQWDGQTQAFNFTVDLAPGTHSLAIDFINDAYGGSASKDRNLYTDQIKVDGKAILSSPVEQWQNGTKIYHVTT